MGGPRVNGAFTVLPSGIGFGGDGAVLRVEFSQDDVAAYPGATETDFRAANLTYPLDYPFNKEAASVTALGLDTPVPIRIENGRQIYAITVPIPQTESAYGAVPKSYAPMTDLALAKISLPETAYQTQEVIYRLTVANTESSYGPPDTAHNVIVTDDLPPETAFVSAAASQGMVAHENGIVTAQLGSMAIGSTATVEIRAAAATVGDVVNTATACAAETDFHPENNTAGTSVTVLPAVDLVVTRTVQSDPVVEEGELHYTIEVTNTGGPLGVPVSATGVVVTDVLPAGVEFSTATVSQGTVTFTSAASGAATGRRRMASAPGILTANIGTLVAGATATVRVVVVALTSGVVEGTATATSTESDVDESNNSTETPTTIEPGTGPDLSGTWSGIRETCRVTCRGMTCTIKGTLDIANTGNATAGRSNVAFYLGSRPELTPDARLLKTQRVGQVRAGAHARVSLSAPLPAGQKSAGRYLIAVIDPANAIAEARERNNVAVFGPIY